MFYHTAICNLIYTENPVFIFCIINYLYYTLYVLYYVYLYLTIIKQFTYNKFSQLSTIGNHVSCQVGLEASNPIIIHCSFAANRLSRKILFT